MNKNAEKKKNTANKAENPPKKRVRFWVYMFPYLKPYLGKLLLSLILSGICGACLSIQPLVIKYIVDSGIGDKPFFNIAIPSDYRVWFVIGCAVFYLVISLCRIFSYRFGYYIQIRIMKNCMLHLRASVFSHIQQLCMRFFDKTPSGEIFNYIMGSPMSSIETYIETATRTLPYTIISFVCSLCALSVYDWQLTLVMFLTAVMMAAMNFLSRRRVRETTKDYLDAERDASTYISDMLHGIDTIKTYSIEDEIVEKSIKQLDNVQKKCITNAITNLRANSRPEFASYTGTAVIYVVGSIACLKRGMTAGMLVAFLSSMALILSSLTTFLSMAFTRNSAEVALEKILKIMETKPTTPEPIPAKAHEIRQKIAEAKAVGAPCVSFRNVSFTYDKKQIFNHFSCDIPYNQSVALVGRSGSGKTTFTKLLLRLYEANEGEILIHNHNIRHYPIHDLRSSFGVVLQNPFIFHDTIWNNVKVTNPHATDEEVYHAMDIARVTEFVKEFPDGVETVLGDGAQSLSGGQKQRVAIARAILKESDFLIFDEATSALDNISEKHIQMAMEDLMKTHTVIIIAHRLSTIKNVDRILVFDEGEIVQDGTYRELSVIPGKFRDMLDVVGDTPEEGFLITNT